jgi:hypothetical protein
MSWSSIHVSYYDEERQDALIVGALRPLFTQIRDQVPRAYFVRHWRRGPHLRLNFHTAPDTFATMVRPAADEIVGGYLAAHHSTVDLDPARLLPLHERLAELEREQGPLQPWYPDNSIQEADYDHRVDVLGSPEAAELLVDFYVDTTDLAFQMTEHVQAGGSRLGTAFDLMIATVQVFSHGTITTGFLSFRSHAEAFLASADHGQDLRTSWDRHYAERASTLTDRVRAVIGALQGDQEPVPFVRAWVAALQPVKHRAEDLVGAGQLALEPPSLGDSAVGPRARPAELSSFHQELEASDRWRREIRSSDSFRVFRLMLNYTYLHLTRLGVKPLERLLLCHLAANAVEDAYGVSAAEIVGQ